MSDDTWHRLRDRLGITAVLDKLDHHHDHLQRQEHTMAKLADELEDIGRRLTSMREAQTASSTNVRAALTRMEQRITELQDGEVDADQQEKLNAMKADLDEARAAAESADDGYEAPIVEPAPVPAVEGQPEPGSVADRDTRGI